MNLKSRLTKLECRKRERPFDIVKTFKQADKRHKQISALPKDELVLLSEDETTPDRGYALSMICRAGIQPSDKAVALEMASIEGMKQRAEQLDKTKDGILLRRIVEGRKRVLAAQPSRFNL